MDTTVEITWSQPEAPEIVEPRSIVIRVGDTGWWMGAGRYVFDVILTPENEGGYSVRSAAIIGGNSQGESVTEALLNIADALRGILTSCFNREEEPNRRSGALVPDDESQFVRQVIVDLSDATAA